MTSLSPAQSSLWEKTHMHGRTIWTYGVTTLHTASEAHGTGAAITTHGTATTGIGTDGRTTLHGATAADGMTLGTMAESMTHGTTEDGMDTAT